MATPSGSDASDTVKFIQFGKYWVNPAFVYLLVPKPTETHVYTGDGGQPIKLKVDMLLVAQQLGLFGDFVQVGPCLVRPERISCVSSRGIQVSRVYFDGDPVPLDVSLDADVVVKSIAAQVNRTVPVPPCSDEDPSDSERLELGDVPVPEYAPSPDVGAKGGYR